MSVDFFDIDWDILDEDIKPISKEELEFGEEMFDLFQSLINNEQHLTEEFTSKNSLKTHYEQHCIGNNPFKKSTKHNIYYDFTNIDKYRIYENKINNIVNSTNMRINYLGDVETINKYFRKLYEGNQAILFTTSCAFTNNIGSVELAVHAYATDKTENYKAGNTVNFLVLSRGKTVTMYSIDAYYLQTKLNNIIKKYTNTDDTVNFIKS